MSPTLYRTVDLSLGGSLSKEVSVQVDLCQGDSLPPCGQTDACETRMHSSRMRTAHAMTGRISWGVHTMHAPLLSPCMPPPSPHMPPLCHACPPLPCMPPLCHACPLGAATHAPPGATTHAPPGATMHAPPGATTRAPPFGQTDTCKNITFANFVCGR